MLMKLNVNTLYICLFGLFAGICSLTAEEADPVRILLVGDSTTIGSTPRKIDPEGLHLEGMIELLAACEGLPRLEVINAGKGGETAQRLLGIDWYEKAIASVREVDIIFVRLGINDWFRCDDFPAEFPDQLKALLSQLKEDHPSAVIHLATICQFMSPKDCEEVNRLIYDVAATKSLQVLDVYTPYHKHLESNGLHSLNVRQTYLEEIPEKYHDFLKPHVSFRKGWGNKPAGDIVSVNGTELDPLFGQYKGWYGDRHPNSAGYHLIALTTVEFLKQRFAEELDR